jgi:hypothetical protein
MVMSILEYVISVWGNTYNKYLLIVEKVVRSLARLLTGKRKYDSIAETINMDLQWLFPKQLCDFKMLCIMFKIVNLKNVPYFNDYFSRVDNAHHHMTRNADVNFVCNVIPRTTQAKGCFSYRAVYLWNRLPRDLKSECNYRNFKDRLKNYLLTLSNCTC